MPEEAAKWLCAPLGVNWYTQPSQRTDKMRQCSSVDESLSMMMMVQQDGKNEDLDGAMTSAVARMVGELVPRRGRWHAGADLGR